MNTLFDKSYYAAGLTNIASFAKRTVRWGAISLVIGALCGFAGAAFDRSVSACDKILAAHPVLIWFLPAAGLLIVFLYKRLKVAGLTTDTVILAAQRGGKIKPLLLPAIFLGTAITHLFGGSAGREGAAFQIGGVIGNWTSRFLKMNEKEIRFMTVSGMAALFAAIFGIPVTATIFVTLVINVGTFWPGAIFPSLVASLTAFGISSRFGVEAAHYEVNMPDPSVLMHLRIIVLAILAAFVSTLFCEVLHLTGRALKSVMRNAYLRIGVTGLAIAVIMNLLGTTAYSGSGTNLIAAATSGEAQSPAVFLLKMILTALTLGAGFKGGEVFPSFAIGAAFGAFMGPILGIPADFAASVCLVTVFGGCSNSLLAPLLLSVELFGGQRLGLYALACVIAYIFSGYSGFYYNQKILFSKSRPERIDINTNETYHDA
ncbi:MAG: chloride channel protein [Lachnospiraceae bacterium]|nr:chloride channel protein [Lachnospiraceae bacterium]